MKYLIVGLGNKEMNILKPGIMSGLKLQIKSQKPLMLSLNHPTLA